MDIRKRDDLLPYTSYRLELKDNSFNSLDSDHFGLRLRDYKSGKNIYKNVYFGVYNPAHGIPWVNIGSNWQTQNSCIYLLTGVQSDVLVRPSCYAEGGSQSIKNHSFDINLYDDHIVAGSAIGDDQLRTPAEVKGHSAVWYAIDELLTPDSLRVGDDVFGSLYDFLRANKPGTNPYIMLATKEEEAENKIIKLKSIIQYEGYALNYVVHVVFRDLVTKQIINEYESPIATQRVATSPTLITSASPLAPRSFSRQPAVIYDEKELQQAIKYNFVSSYLSYPRSFFNVVGQTLDSFTQYPNLINPWNNPIVNIEDSGSFIGHDYVLPHGNHDAVIVGGNYLLAGSNSLENASYKTLALTTSSYSISKKVATHSETTSGWSIGARGSASFSVAPIPGQREGVEAVIFGDYNRSTTTGQTSETSYEFKASPQTIPVPPHAMAQVDTFLVLKRIRGSFSVLTSLTKDTTVRLPNPFREYPLVLIDK